MSCRPLFREQLFQARDIAQSFFTRGAGHGAHLRIADEPISILGADDAHAALTVWIATRSSLESTTPCAVANAVSAGQYPTGIEDRRRISEIADGFAPIPRATAAFPPRALKMSSTVFIADMTDTLYVEMSTLFVLFFLECSRL